MYDVFRLVAEHQQPLNYLTLPFEIMIGVERDVLLAIWCTDGQSACCSLQAMPNMWSASIG